MYFYSFEDEHHLNLHLVKSVPPVSWYFEVQQEVILKIKTKGKMNIKTKKMIGDIAIRMKLMNTFFTIDSSSS